LSGKQRNSYWSKSC